MKNREYTESVVREFYPLDPIVPLDAPFEDARGAIQNLVLTPGITSVAVITSKAGSERSNHFHKTDWHYLYVVEGEMEYYERPVGATGGHIKPLIVKKGQMVFTPPNIVHKTVFTVDTVLVSLAKNVRDHSHHEEDVVREIF